ncbi:hypothetical protein D3C80_1297350 [compost metagenome]
MSQQASGKMKGKVEIFSTDHQLIEEFEFDSHKVSRRVAEGLIFDGMMFRNDAAVIISLQFFDIKQPSGTFLYPGREIKDFIFFHEHPRSLYIRSGGVVVFQNNDSDVMNINGKLTFSTEVKDSKYYKVEVIFTIAGMD